MGPIDRNILTAFTASKTDDIARLYRVHLKISSSYYEKCAPGSLHERIAADVQSYLK